LIIQLCETHALINSLTSKNTMLVKTVESLENELKEFKDLLNKLSSDTLKSILCIQEYVSNKLSMIVDDLGTSTSHAYNFEMKSLFVKPVIVEVNIACLDHCENYYLKNCVEHKSKDHEGKQTQGKFVYTCHQCVIML